MDAYQTQWCHVQDLLTVQGNKERILINCLVLVEYIKNVLLIESSAG